MPSENAERKRRTWYRVDGERILLNQESVARFFQVTTRTIRDWVGRGCPEEGRGWYDPAAIMRWRGGEGRKEDAGAAGETMEARKLRAETLYRERKAEREQIQLDALKEMYLPREAVADEWASRIIELKAGLLAMARKAAGAVADPGMRRIVERVISDEIYDLLDQYARAGTYTPRPGKKAAKTPNEKATTNNGDEAGKD